MTRLIHLTTVDMSLELLLGHQLRAARHAGYEVVGVSAPGPWVAGLEEAGIRHIPLPHSTRGFDLVADVRAAIEFWRILKRERPQILHTHNPKPGLYGRVLGRLAGVPIVVNTIHGLYAAPDDPIAKRVLVYALEAMAARFSDHELVQSAEDVRLMKRLHLAPPSRVSHLGNGVDTVHFDRRAVQPQVVENLRMELGVSEGEPVVGCVGRLVAEKGWRELLAAVNQLRGRGISFTTLAIGPADPQKPDALPADELRRAEADGVKFLGLRGDMRELYALMDLFVLPSHREGFPRAAMEAASMGLPIIATNIRGCREVVEQGVNGLLVEPHSPEAVVEAIDRLLSDKDRRQSMGVDGRRLALARFDVRQVVSTVLATYQEVAEKKGVPLLAAPGRPWFALTNDAPAIARLHGRSISTGFLTLLGEKFLTQVYKGLINDPDVVVLVVKNEQEEVIGFIAGCRSTRRAYRRLLIRRLLPLALAALPAMLAKPGRLRRALETLRYPAEVSAQFPDAELLAMAVTEEFRSRGLGADLVSSFLALLRVPEVRVVVGLENQRARSFYRGQGFTPTAEIEVHAGQRSEVLVWSSSPL